MFLNHLIVHAIGRTRAGQYFTMLMSLLCALALPVGSIAVFGGFAWHELALEASYSKHFGPNWKVQYEEQQGSLTKARVRIGLVLVAAVVNGFVGVWLYRQLFRALVGQGYSSTSTHRRRRKSRAFK